MIDFLFVASLALWIGQDSPPPQDSAGSEPPRVEQNQEPQEEAAPEKTPPTEKLAPEKPRPENSAQDNSSSDEPAHNGGKAEKAEPKDPGEEQAEEHVSDDQRVEANYREAMRTYQDVFSQESGMDLKNVQTRISANEKLLADHTSKLNEAEARLRSLRTGFDRKVIAARQGQKEGRIPQAVFDQMVTEQKRQKASQERDLEGDIAFYRQEVAALRVRLTELQSRQRLLAFDADLSGAKRTPKKPPPLSDEIMAKFQKLNRFELRPIPLPYHDEKGGCDACRECVLRRRG